MARVLDRFTAPRTPIDLVRKHGVEEFHGISLEESDKAKFLSRPDPGPTRLADPNRSPGRDTIDTIYCILGLSLTCSLSCTCTCGYTNNFCNNKNYFTYTKELPPKWCPSKSIYIY